MCGVDHHQQLILWNSHQVAIELVTSTQLPKEEPQKARDDFDVTRSKKTKVSTCLMHIVTVT